MKTVQMTLDEDLVRSVDRVVKKIHTTRSAFTRDALRDALRRFSVARPDKKRPVLILTRDSILEYLGEVTVAPVTSTIRDIPSEVALTKDDGMPRPCAVNCDHIQTVAKGRLGSRITALSEDKMSDVAKSIGFALNLW